MHLEYKKIEHRGGVNMCIQVSKDIQRRLRLTCKCILHRKSEKEFKSSISLSSMPSDNIIYICTYNYVYMHIDI